MTQFGGSDTAEIESAHQRCYELAADVERYPEWHPVIDSMEVLERDPDGRVSRARLVVDANVSTVTVEVGLTYEASGAIQCQRLSGDLNEMFTRFEFVEVAPDRTRLDYSTGLDPGRMLSMMARGPVLEKIRRKLVGDAVSAFKRLCESE